MVNKVMVNKPTLLLHRRMVMRLEVTALLRESIPMDPLRMAVFNMGSKVVNMVHMMLVILRAKQITSMSSAQRYIATMLTRGIVALHRKAGTATRRINTLNRAIIRPLTRKILITLNTSNYSNRATKTLICRPITPMPRMIQMPQKVSED